MPNVIIGKEKAFSKGFFFTDETKNIDLSNASYNNVSFDVSNEDTGPLGLAFNGDGTKMFLAGNSNDSIYEYNLSTGFDLSTLSYSGTSFSVRNEDAAIRDVTFNPGGSKLFMTGNNNSTIYRYDLTTGFDISTASYSGTSFSLSSEDGSPQGTKFNGDGTKMFVIGKGKNGNVYEYDLTTGFDISTASYSGTSFSVRNEENSTRGLAFNGDGTKMFVIGNSSESIHQYDLSTGFDISTASYSGTSFSVSSEDGGPQGLVFNGDGSKMIVPGNSTDSVYEYTL